MQTAIWTKTTSHGTFEVDGRVITLNGAVIASCASKAARLPKPITKDGKTFTHFIGGKVGLTDDETIAYNAAMAAYAKSIEREIVVDPSDKLSWDMNRENSAL